MQELFNKLKAVVTIQITGAYPGDLINRLAEAKVSFWDLVKEDELTWRITMFAGDYKKIMIHAKRSMCRVHILKREGLPFFTRKFKKRTALLAGLTLVLIAVAVLPKYIWYFEVEGNETVPDQQIIRALNEAGVSVGTYGPSIRGVAVKNKVLPNLPELSWLTINVSGGKATVVVRERIEKPEILNESIKSDLVADKTGIITKVEVLRGRSLVAVGQTVLAGDLLVSGEIPHENNINTVQTVRSMGEIYARTWYKLTAVTPKTYGKKNYTEQTEEKYVIIFFGKRINLYFSSGKTFPKYDKIVELKQLKIPGGITFPIAVEKSVCSEYEMEQAELQEQDAEEILKQYLIRQLTGSIIGGVTQDKYICANSDEFFMMTMNAECEEQIAQEVERSIFE